MATGRLRHRITIQRLDWSGVNSYGEKVPVWVAEATIWASVAPLKGNEFFSQSNLPQSEAQVEARIRIRSRKGLDPALIRVKHESTIYDVLAIIQDIKNYETQLMVRARALDQGPDEAVNP